MARRPKQLALELPPRRTWGGRRAGAGRPPTGRKAGLPHARRAHFGAPLPAHVTLRIRADVPSLRRAPVVRELERSFRVARARQGFRLVHYSLQGNHAHLIVEARDRDALGRAMKSIGARIARAVNRTTGHQGSVLADRYHLRLLPTPREVRNALRYVLLNARRHAASAASAASAVGAVGAVVQRPVRLDPASSARWFDGWKSGGGAERNDASDDERPVARAQTWLLAVGWRRHGLLDPADVPGRPATGSG